MTKRKEKITNTESKNHMITPHATPTTKNKKKIKSEVPIANTMGIYMQETEPEGEKKRCTRSNKPSIASQYANQILGTVNQLWKPERKVRIKNS